MAWRILCETSEVAVECSCAAQTIGLAAEPEVTRDWVREARSALTKGTPIAIAVVDPPSLDPLVELSHLARPQRLAVVIGIFAANPEADRILDVVGDLGITGASDARPLVAALALAGAGAVSPWSCSLRSLPAVDRARLRPVMGSGGRVRGQLSREHGGLIAWSADGKSQRVLLGEARDAAQAIRALHRTDRSTAQVLSSVEGVDEQSVLGVIFGPPRALSDPASKAALMPYGIPVPTEEVCGSASRTAAEAGRMGFPVRIALASPDLRVWDHPDLAVDTVDNAARVREVFGQLVALARTRAPESRLLGVTVAAATQTAALLSVRATPLPHGRVCMEIGFADPHGKASRDSTAAIMPAPLLSVSRAIARLRGSDLILSGKSTQRRRNLESIFDTLLRVASFVNDRRSEVDSVELLPLALLLDGSVEVREACVSVNDAFERSIQDSIEREVAVQQTDQIT